MPNPSKITRVEKTFFVDDGAKRGPMTMLRIRFHPREARLIAQVVDRRVALFDLNADATEEVKGKGKAVLGKLVCPHDIGWVRAIEFHPSGEWLATGGSDRSLRVWKWEAGQPAETPVHRAAAHEGWVEGIAFSPDGSMLVTAGSDKQVKVWGATDLSPIKTLSGHTQFVADVAFAPDGSSFVTGGEDGQATLWDAKTFRPLRTFAFGDSNDQSGQIPRHSGVHRLAISHGQRWLAVAGGQKLDLYDLQSGECVASEKVGMDAAFHPTASLLSGGESEVRCWEYESEKLAPAGKDKNGKSRSVPSIPGKLVGALKRGDWSLGLQFSPDGQRLAMGKSDGTFDLYEVS